MFQMTQYQIITQCPWILPTVATILYLRLKLLDGLNLIFKLWLNRCNNKIKNLLGPID